MRSLRSMGNDENIERYEHNRNGNCHKAQTTMNVLPVSRYQTGLRENEREPGRQHDAMDVEIERYWGYMEKLSQIERLAESEEHPSKQQAGDNRKVPARDFIPSRS